MAEYYTPTIEEFHVGFEYEVFKPSEDNPERKWKKITFYYGEVDRTYNQTTMIINYPGLSKQPLVRVKHLDREDIESLGFEHTGRTIDDWYELKVSRPAVMSAHTNRRYVLMHDFRTNQGVVIMAYDYESGDSGENTIYRGSCKNKSELKKLLKQIGYEISN